eukprot:CAMPEP_0205999786 /NCGR_PEP_ID=MMETSP1464-20131121/1067_1 /ASSEMBLY_ACC=CAM_ASM_001124 /TAXON_ID=119497 /ORGANISM="Exanthemachrysis gayraliae, Strain RCC1523" /LENGTH=196 /DNA_ID=CAMNT_0053373011 /DNA_START=84 /DNA_END=673 /DNA_ORIENTATION=+
MIATARAKPRGAAAWPDASLGPTCTQAADLWAPGSPGLERQAQVHQVLKGHAQGRHVLAAQVLEQGRGGVHAHAARAVHVDLVLRVNPVGQVAVLHGACEVGERLVHGVEKVGILPLVQLAHVQEYGLARGHLVEHPLQVHRLVTPLAMARTALRGAGRHSPWELPRTNSAARGRLTTAAVWYKDRETVSADARHS